jgi:hypothetical protein
MHKPRATMEENDSSEHKANNDYKGNNQALRKDSENNKNSTEYMYILLSHKVTIMTFIISAYRLPTIMDPIKYELDKLEM